MEKYGFVYIWFDRKHKRYYVGSHWGIETDSYICSSKWMLKAYKRRPEDFKRKIIKRIYTDKKELLTEENRYLAMIKLEELHVRYYNLRIHEFGHWSADPVNSLTAKEKMRNAKLGKSPWNKGVPNSKETREKLSKALKGREVWNTGLKFNLTEEAYSKHGYKYQKEMKWFTNGKESKLCLPKDCPEGFYEGRTHIETEGHKRMAIGKIGKRCYNNGKVSKWFIPGTEPSNFTLGRAKI